jgi:hypothetical protein
MSTQLPPADKAAGECEESFVDVVAAVGADEESAAVVQPCGGAFDDPALSAEARAVFDLPASDDRLDSAFPDQPTVLVVVVAAVGDQRPQPAPRPADATADGWYAVEQLESLEGGLTLKNSTVTGNQAIASAPNGRFAETGGVFVGSGTLTMDGSLVRHDHQQHSHSQQ